MIGRFQHHRANVAFAVFAALVLLPLLPEDTSVVVLAQSLPIPLWAAGVVASAAIIAHALLRARVLPRTGSAGVVTTSLLTLSCAVAFAALVMRVEAASVADGWTPANEQGEAREASEAREARPSSFELRVVSFNTLHWDTGGGSEALREMLAAFEADILLLQEQSNARGPHDVVPIDGRPDLQACCDYPYLFSRGGLLVASRFPGRILAQASEDVLLVELAVGHRRVLVANVHNPVHLSLHHLRRAPFSAAFFAFTRSAVERRGRVYELMRGLAQRSEPVIVGGDFNATALMSGFRRSVFLPLGGRLADLFPGSFPSAIPLVRIDHILASAHFARSCSVMPDPDPVSDHRPLGCRVILRGP